MKVVTVGFMIVGLLSLGTLAATAVKIEAPPAYESQLSPLLKPGELGCVSEDKSGRVVIPARKSVLALPKLSKEQSDRIEEIYKELGEQLPRREGIGPGFRESVRAQQAAQHEAWQKTKTILTQKQKKVMSTWESPSKGRVLEITGLDSKQKAQIEQFYEKADKMHVTPPEPPPNFLHDQHVFLAGVRKKIENVLSPKQLQSFRAIQY